MKKITDFIIDKRYIILFLFTIFTIVAAVTSKDVSINHDISKYLPDTSETRIGKNIMEEEFANTETSNLNIMFRHLKEEEKESIKQELENIDGIKEVKYENTEEYNKEDCTIYIITIDDKKDSSFASEIYTEITEKYQDKEFYTSGEVSNTNKSVLPFWIIALAVFCAFVILEIMCESYVEPILFLTTILMAVVLNKGTNIIFPSVSHITDSIVAILQMALSMDYSIMLMNRYNQEKSKEKDKITAMKNALHKAFQSISSSSVTTIVGLLALVFMSFKIGKDLGFILAKGVLFSLICIFLVLPSLILLFDKWIEKTKKKSPNLKLNQIGKISYKFRYLSLPLFILIFVCCYFIKGNLGIDYTDRQSDEISKVFKENNQIAIIYKKNEEEKIASNLKKLENIENVNEVLGYSNTINQKLYYNELNAKLKDLGSEITVEDFLIKIIYYDYFHPEKNNQITFEEFIKFLEEEAYNNPKMNNKITENTKKDIEKLKNFVSAKEINKKRSATEIGNILSLNSSKIEELLIYYRSKNNNQKLTLPQFVNFINKDVLTNKKYADRIDNEKQTKLNLLSKFVSKETLIQQKNTLEISNLFGIPESKVEELFKYYLLTNEIDQKLSINEFVHFVKKDILSDPAYTNAFSPDLKEQIELVAIFSDKELITKNLNTQELSKLFGVEEEQLKQLYLQKYIQKENESKYTIVSFLTNIKNIKENSHYLDDLDIVPTNPDLLNDSKEYTYDEMAQLLGREPSEINQIYNLIDFMNQTITMTPYEVVNMLLENKESLEETTRNKLILLQTIMTNSIKDQKFSYQECAKLFGMDETLVKKIYTLFIYSKKDTTMTPQEFVNFLVSHQKDSLLEANISPDTIQELNLIQTIMTNVLNDTALDSKKMANLLNIKEEDINLLYGLYNSIYINKNITISLKDFISFLLQDVIKNPEYSSNFNSETIKKLNTLNTIMNNSLNNRKYTAEEIFAITSTLSNDIEKNDIEVLYVYYGSEKEYDENWQMTVEEFVNYLNNTILTEERYEGFIEENEKEEITDAKSTIQDAKDLLIGKNYARVVLNTKWDLEGEETFTTIEEIQKDLKQDLSEVYVIGDSPMAYEMSQTFDNELNLITIITMIAIFIVVAFTFHSVLIPFLLVLTIQCAVYLTMGILSITGENVYFIAILIVQSILMGATIDYAILYTSYYLEHRKTLGVKESLIESYNKSINTILTSSSILILVTLIIAFFASAIAAKICKTISEGTLCSTILILVFLPAILALCDKWIVKKKEK